MPQVVCVEGMEGAQGLLCCLYLCLEWGGEEGEEGGDVPCMSDVVSCVEFLILRPECQDTMAQLLGERSVEGYTPFMTAVTNKV